jgi:hypothetical protein
MSTAPCAVGDRIELVLMGKDPDPIPPGTRGTVTSVGKAWHDGKRQISVRWDIKRSLHLVWPDDQIKVIRKVEEDDGA